jgi:alpha-galactosidase
MTKIVLIGAGSATFGLGTIGDILKSRSLQGSSIVLHDIDSQALSRVEDIAQRFVKENSLPYTVSATTSRRDALQAAAFCIISIEVGNRFELWEQDWKVPLQYGIRQVYGENGGPGGLFHALRIIPPILEICADISQICPEAYIINFSNPMSRICLAIHRKYPDLKVIGMCHEVGSLPRHLPRMLETPLSNLSFKAGGLNHFSVLLEVTYNDTGKDAYPDVRQNAITYFENLSDQLANIPSQSNEHKLVERWLFKEILERFGYLPITSDSHFGEYIQWAHEVVDHKGILDFYSRYKKRSLEQVSADRIQGTPRQEFWRVVPVMESILTNSQHAELGVNIPNNGFIDNLPQDLVVEVPAIVNGSGVHGLKLGLLPKGIAGLLYNQVAIHELTVETVLTGSRTVALQALLVDPVVNSVKSAEQTLDTMLELQARYLGYIR